MPLEDLQEPCKVFKLFRATLELIQEDLYDEQKQISRYLTPQCTKFEKSKSTCFRTKSGGETVKATWNSSAAVVCCVVPAKSKIWLNFLPRIVFSDEQVFHISGIVNNKNEKFWGNENHGLVQKHQLHSSKITAWCGIHSNVVFDP